MFNFQFQIFSTVLFNQFSNWWICVKQSYLCIFDRNEFLFKHLINLQLSSRKVVYNFNKFCLVFVMIFATHVDPKCYLWVLLNKYQGWCTYWVCAHLNCQTNNHWYFFNLIYQNLSKFQFLHLYRLILLMRSQSGIILVVQLIGIYRFIFGMPFWIMFLTIKAHRFN